MKVLIKQLSKNKLIITNLNEKDSDHHTLKLKVMYPHLTSKLKSKMLIAHLSLSHRSLSKNKILITHLSKNKLTIIHLSKKSKCSSNNLVKMKVFIIHVSLKLRAHEKV